MLIALLDLARECLAYSLPLVGLRHAKVEDEAAALHNAMHEGVLDGHDHHGRHGTVRSLVDNDEQKMLHELPWLCVEAVLVLNGSLDEAAETLELRSCHLELSATCIVLRLEIAEYEALGELHRGA